MILYHGTNKAFDTIDLTKSKPNKDFGQGFYLSREYSQAMAYLRLQENETQLYHQSPRYVYSFLVNELKKGKVE